MTDTHKPLPAAKVKELEQWLSNHIGFLENRHKYLMFKWLKRENATKILCYQNILNQLQSLINEAEDE